MDEEAIIYDKCGRLVDKFRKCFCAYCRSGDYGEEGLLQDFPLTDYLLRCNIDVAN